jgi:hypothetical protein
METMTGKQLGGPCGFAREGATADEVIKWKHPGAGMGCYEQAKRDFAALSQDRSQS